MAGKKTRFRWRHARLWPTLVAYWLIATTGAAVAVRLSGDPAMNTQVVWTVFFVFVCMCMLQERSGWITGYRVGFIVVALLAAQLPFVILLSVLGLAGAPGGLETRLDRGAAFLGSLPVLLFAMRRSLLFVVPRETPGEPFVDTSTGP